MSKSTNVFWHENHVLRADREARQGHPTAVIWFTGLSGSGKSTLANELDWRLFERGVSSYVLDGDNIRHGLNGDLGFSPEARTENIRRIGEVAKLFADAGTIAITAFISPYREDRDKVRALLDRDEDFLEVFVEAPLEVCEERDPKGLYKKARSGEIPEFTGISAPYEAPLSPEIVVNTSSDDVATCVDRIIDVLAERGYLPAE
ncbi:MAG: adenylyl-sulfate kinase [marine benthic group bacterium]|nr:adenylyl-sulfate kinase [Gemmatimonadota bacterium]MCL7962207.1 adenylyl-sulfate kinase [Candidatus Carthagonibacter metallireducens]MCL7970337.1 adenylyl-sulfate kinase [Gemmatimonadota bacterium]MCL7979909.1 adenylyl-sulfate kinase [Gemmatimonadota bacterium]MCL7981297.1 adenylyl-sulfate kinase [Gemmatimonadota bacterium]